MLNLTFISRRAVCWACSASLLWTVACDSSSTEPEAPSPSRDASPFQTELLTYTMSYKAGAFSTAPRSVVITFTNRTGGSVYLVKCDPSSQGPLLGLVKDSADQSISELSNPALSCVGTPPIEVRAGEIRRDSVTLVLVDSKGAGGAAYAGKSGLYRVSVEAYAQVDDRGRVSAPLADSLRRSNLVRLEFSNGS